MSMSPTESLPLVRRFVSTPLGRLAYLEHGDGPVAVFVHGVFFSADLWVRQLEGLADVRRCVALDLLAHGESDVPPAGPMSLELQAHAVLALLDALGEREVDLVGNDTGGAIVQLVAASAPGRVRTMTLTNCDTDENLPPAAFQPIVDLARAGQLAPSLPAVADDPALARSSVAMGFEHPEALSDEFLASAFGPFRDPARAAALEAYVASLRPATLVSIRGALGTLETPTCVVWGDDDAFFGTEWAAWLARTLPCAEEPVIVPGARLFFPLERPDELHRAVRPFWSRNLA